MAGYKVRQGSHEQLIPPTPEELQAILEVPPDHLRQAIILSFNLGLRVGESELLKLKWSDFDLNRGCVTFETAKKSDIEKRTVPLRADMMPQLEEWKAADDEAGVEYVIHWAKKPVKRLKQSWKNSKERAGISRRIRLYDLRHTFATYALEAGVDSGTVAKIMGHTNIKTVHQHVLDRQKVAAVEALPALV